MTLSGIILHKETRCNCKYFMLFAIILFTFIRCTNPPTIDNAEPEAMYYEFANKILEQEIVNYSSHVSSSYVEVYTNTLNDIAIYDLCKSSCGWFAVLNTDVVYAKINSITVAFVFTQNPRIAKKDIVLPEKYRWNYLKTAFNQDYDTYIKSQMYPDSLYEQVWTTDHSQSWRLVFKNNILIDKKINAVCNTADLYNPNTFKKY